MRDWLLVPCTGNRRLELLRLLSDLQFPCDRVCVVTTQPDPFPFCDKFGLVTNEINSVIKHVIRLDDEINYSKWINAGLDYIDSNHIYSRYVFITGSDTRSDQFSIPTLMDKSESRGLVMSGPDHWGLGDIDLDRSKKRAVNYRIPPEYFLLDLRYGFRMDEQFRWWFSDDDLEMQARQLGPVGLVSGLNFSQPEFPYGHTLGLEKERWVKEDRIKFINKWGIDPW